MASETKKKISSSATTAFLQKQTQNKEQKLKDEEEEEEEEDEEEESVTEDSENSSESEDQGWISWFCNLKGNEFFCEVDEEYIQDDFNLTGLNSMILNYEYALDLILDGDLDGLTESQHESVEQAAEVLYGLIHARFIITSRGLQQMQEKFNSVDFGRCPRVFCQGQSVLPVGQSDIPKTNTVKLYCPKCQDIYHPRHPKHQNIDGAYFGTTFPNLFLLTYPESVPTKANFSYVPKIFGFKIHKSAQCHPKVGSSSSITTISAPSKESPVVANNIPASATPNAPTASLNANNSSRSLKK